jgi:hypothetical protein
MLIFLLLILLLGIVAAGIATRVYTSKQKYKYTAVFYTFTIFIILFNLLQDLIISFNAVIFLIMWLMFAVWFIAALIGSVVFLFKFRKTGIAAYAPLLFIVVIVLAQIYLPYEEIYLSADYLMNNRQREEIANRVSDGGLYEGRPVF